MTDAKLFIDAAYGAVIGMALGMTGGGGSIVTLPLLVYAIGEDVHTAIGTSLAVVGGIATQGFISQRTRVNWKVGFALGIVGIAGSIPGSLLASHVAGKVLLLLFAGVMVLAALAMLRSRHASAMEGGKHNWAVLVAAGVGLGFLTGFLGVGGGFLIVPTMVFALGFTMRAAIPTSLLVIALNSFVALAARASTSTIAWPTVTVLLLGGIFGSLIGAYVARSLDQKRLKQIFAVFVLCVGIFTGGSALGIIPIRVH